METIPTVNYHLTNKCNYRCKYCFAKFNDLNNNELSFNKQKQLIKQLAESGLFKKINFAGGEPTLNERIIDLICWSKESGFGQVGIISNGSMVDIHWLKRVKPYLDILGLSVDSFVKTTSQGIGRKPLDINKLMLVSDFCKSNGIGFKINTVVSRFNKNEILTEKINALSPFRWKVLQATQIDGQTDLQFHLTKITSNDFSIFCRNNRNGLAESIRMVEESSDIIESSYLMIDPCGRFFDDNNLRHNYSQSILEIGVEKALSQISNSVEKFETRGGYYHLSFN